MAKNVQDYREQDYTRFPLKVGGNPDTDFERIHAARAMLLPIDPFVTEANTGWTQPEALRVVEVTR